MTTCVFDSKLKLFYVQPEPNKDKKVEKYFSELIASFKESEGWDESVVLLTTPSEEVPLESYRFTINPEDPSPWTLYVYHNETAELYFPNSKQSQQVLRFERCAMTLYDELINWIKGCSTFSDQVEVIDRTPDELLDDEYWSQWRIEDVPSRNAYKDIHEAVLDAVKGLIPKRAKVLEICGGDGIFAGELLKEVEEIASYTFIERNADSMHAARERLGEQDNVTLVQEDIAKEDIFADIPDGSLDLVLGIGALTYQVVDEQTAEKVAKKAFDLLAPGGHLVLTGYQRQLLDKEALEKLGYEVFSTYHPGIKRQFYIAKKPEEPRFQEELSAGLIHSLDLKENYF